MFFKIIASIRRPINNDVNVLYFGTNYFNVPHIKHEFFFLAMEFSSLFFFIFSASFFLLGLKYNQRFQFTFLNTRKIKFDNFLVFLYRCWYSPKYFLNAD